MRRYIEIYSIMLRNSLIREMSFKANFLLWMIVEILWFCGQIVFFSIIFGQVDHIGDWTKWEVVLLVGTHQIIAQLFQTFPNWCAPESWTHCSCYLWTASLLFPASNSPSTASSTPRWVAW